MTISDRSVRGILALNPKVRFLKQLGETFILPEKSMVGDISRFASELASSVKKCHSRIQILMPVGFWISLSSPHIWHEQCTSNATVGLSIVVSPLLLTHLKGS